MATARSEDLDRESVSQYPEHPVYRGLRFSDGNMSAALELLDILEAQGPTEYDLADDEVVVMPAWMVDRLLPMLEERGVPYDRVRIVSISELPPERQAALRGWIRGNG